MTAPALREQRPLGARLFDAAASLDVARLSVFFLLLIPVVSGLRGKLADPDLWWHLRAGEWIVAHRAVPWTDPYSYTAFGREWIAYSWLAEVLFHELARHLGFASLIVLKSAAGAALLALAYLACRATGARPTASVLTSALAALGTAGAWGERPQLLSLVLLAALRLALGSPSLRARLAWLAPAIVVVWTNVHLLFVVGVALLWLFALCETIEGRPSGALWTAAALGSAVTLANPYGWRLLAHMPTMARQPAIARAVAEFQSPDFATLLGLLIAVFLVASTAVLVASPERPTLFELATFLGPLALGLVMVRNMPIFAVLAAPTVARHLDPLLPASSGEAAARPRPALVALHWALLISGLVLAAVFVPRGGGWRENVAPKLFPVEAADFVAERYRAPRLFNDFDWGGFLIFRLYPSTLVSIDGRTQVYGDEMLAAYTRTHYALRGWDRFLKSCAPDVVLWPADGPFAELLRASLKWRVVYEDEVAVVFEKVEVERSRGGA